MIYIQEIALVLLYICHFISFKSSYTTTKMFKKKIVGKHTQHATRNNYCPSGSCFILLLKHFIYKVKAIQLM